MPTTNFPLTDPAFVYGGQWGTVTNGPGPYYPCLISQGANTTIDFAFTGTGCALAMSYVDGSANLQVSIDGAALTNVAANNSWAAVTLCSGLSDTAHTVRVRVNTVLTGDHWWTVIANGFGLSVTGASPAISVTPGFAQPLLCSDSAVFPVITPEGGWSLTAGSYFGTSGMIQTHCYDVCLRFKATCSTIKLWTWQAGWTGRLLVDDVDQGVTLAPANDQTMGWYTVSSSLDASAEHTYSIQITNVANPSYQTPNVFYCYQLMAAGGSGVNLSSMAARRPGLFAFGDSISTALYATDSSNGFVLRVARSLKYAAANDSLAGRTVKQFAGGGASTTSASGQAYASDIAALNLSPSPRLGIVLLGSNDMAQIGGSETAGDLQTAMAAMLSTLLTSAPQAKLAVLGILPRQGMDLTAWNAAIVAAIVAVNSPRVTFIDTTGWLNPATDFVDNIHPTSAGHAKIAAALLPAVKRLLGAASVDLSFGNFLTPPVPAAETFASFV